MSRFILPSRRGTELMVQQTAIPARVVVIGVNRSDGARQLIENRYMGQVTTFYWRQVQMRSLSLAPTYVGREESDAGIIFTLISLYGQDTITVEVPQGFAERRFAAPFVVRLNYDQQTMIEPFNLIEHEIRLPEVRDRGRFTYIIRNHGPNNTFVGQEYVGVLIDPNWLGERYGIDTVYEGDIDFNPIPNSRYEEIERQPIRKTIIQYLARVRSGVTAYDYSGTLINVPQSPPVFLGWPQPPYLGGINDANTALDDTYSSFTFQGGIRDTPWPFAVGTAESFEPSVLNSVGAGYIDYPWWAVAETTDPGSNFDRTRAEAVAVTAAQHPAEVTIVAVPGKYKAVGPPPFSVPLTPPSPYRDHDAYTISSIRGAPVADFFDDELGFNQWYATVSQGQPTTFVVDIIAYPGQDLRDFWEGLEAIEAADEDAQWKFDREAELVEALKARLAVGGTVISRRSELYDPPLAFGTVRPPSTGSNFSLQVRPELDIDVPVPDLDYRVRADPRGAINMIPTPPETA